MANYNNLKATINANIKANGNEEITGPILNTVLNQAVTTLGDGWSYKGIATPSMSPGTPDSNVFYIATTAGTYTNFGSLAVAEGEVAILKYNGSWAKEVTGAATAAQVTQLGQKVSDIATGKYYGYYATANDLPEDADVDGFAYVGTGPTYTIYNCQNGTWTSSGLTVNQSPIGNEDDIDQDPNGKLQFAGRVYDSQNPNGMGYIILRKDKTFAEQLTQTNTIYEIRYDFDLGDASVTIPKNCVLKFEGGKLSNGTIVGQETSITAGIVYIFSQVLFEGQWSISEVYPEWFGAKGDFIVSVGYGTDDSQAFTAAIKAANQLNVNKVALSSAMYSITQGIEITDGNILIQGTYANLREDQKFSYNTNVKIGLGSSLVSYKANYIFKVTSTATHPVDFENVNFYNFRSLRDDEKPRAIQFSSEFGGPLSPVIINKCYFRGFDICIFSSSELAYNLSSVRVTQCAFMLNQHCVYFAYNGNSPFGMNYSYTFAFEDNRAHQNAYILTLSILFGNAWIRRNNLEGPKTPDLYGNTPGPICSTIRMASGANIVVEDNYAEQTNGRVLMGFEVFKPTVATNLLPNRCHLTYLNNRHFETDNKFFYIASKGTQDTISNYLAKEFQLEVLSDFPFRVSGYLHLFLKDGCNEDIRLTDSSCLWLHTNKKLGSQATTMQLESDYNYLASCDASTTAGTPTMKVIGDKLYTQRGSGITGHNIASRISLAEASVRYIIAGARCVSTLPLDNQSVLFFDDSSYFAGVPIMAAKGYDWCYAIRRINNFNNSRLYTAYYIQNTNTFTSTIELWSLSADTLTFNNLNQAEKYNATLSTYLPSISDAPEGMILYLSDLKKTVVWNGTAWVNMDGTALA